MEEFDFDEEHANLSWAVGTGTIQLFVCLGVPCTGIVSLEASTRFRCYASCVSSLLFLDDGWNRSALGGWTASASVSLDPDFGHPLFTSLLVALPRSPPAEQAYSNGWLSWLCMGMSKLPGCADKARLGDRRWSGELAVVGRSLIVGSLGGSCARRCRLRAFVPGRVESLTIDRTTRDGMEGMLL